MPGTIHALRSSDMPRLPRKWILEEGLSLHKVWRGHNREWNLKTPQEKLKYLDLLNEELAKHANPLHALTLMSNHSHEIYSLADLPSFSNFMRQHHGRYGQFFNRRHGRKGKVAQDRPFTSAIEDDAHDMETVFYIHANPLRAKMVKDAKNYLWSTHRLYAFGLRVPWMKHITFPQWYMNLGSTMKERQRRYRILFDAYLREKGLIRQTYSVYGIGTFLWVMNRRRQILDRLQAARQGIGPPG